VLKAYRPNQKAGKKNPRFSPWPLSYLTVRLMILLFLLPGKGSVRNEKYRSKFPFSWGAIRVNV
jgi:hypothetical protein